MIFACCCCGPAGFSTLELSTLAIAEQQSEGVNTVNEAVEGITGARTR